MAAGEQVKLQISGGGPWGFRLYGGDDEPLVVAKLRKRSKAHDAGMLEGDIILGINSYSCQGLAHSTAMGLVDAPESLCLSVLRGTSDQDAINAAFQTLGAQLRPVPASALTQGATPAQQKAPSPRPAASPARTPAAPAQRSAPAAAPVARTQPQRGAPATRQVATGYSRQEQTYKEGDRLTHVTTETSREQHGGTTVTKVKRERVSHGFSPAKPLPNMFQVANISNTAAAPKPGVWTPGGQGVKLQQNPDQSVTMTIGTHQPMDESKENIAPLSEPRRPIPPMFKVSNLGKNTPSGKQWNPGTAPVPQEPQHKPAEFQMDTGDITLLPDEEAQIQQHLERMQQPIPMLQRILIGGADSDLDSGPESPGIFGRTHMDISNQDSDEEGRKKLFADSAFYDDPEHKYPTIDEQVKMARKVAMSLLAPANKKARGHRMFMKRMVKSQKWTTDQDRMERDFEWQEAGSDEEKYYKDNPWASQGPVWEPPKPALGSIPLGIPEPPPGPMPHLFNAPQLPISGPRKEEKMKVLSADEFEKMRLFESKSEHKNVSPQLCFSLAQDLRSMKGKGGKLFAKRVARAEKWDESDATTEGVGTKPNPELISKIAMQASMTGANQPMMAPKKSAAADGGAPVNRLQNMINPPKPKMTPWDAEAEGNLDMAFEHLKEYAPYGRSHKGEIVDKLGHAVQKMESSAGLGPISSLPTSGQPAKIPEFSSKIKPWKMAEGGEQASSASGPAFSAPPPTFQPSGAASAASGGFRRVKFQSGSTSSLQPPRTSAPHQASPARSTGSGAAVSGGEEAGICDL